MNIFNRFKKKNAAQRLLEERLYEIVLEELQKGVRRAGLWAKALAKSEGDESKAKALYISFRAQSLKDELELAEGMSAPQDKCERDKDSCSSCFYYKSSRGIDLHKGHCSCHNKVTYSNWSCGDYRKK